MLRQAHTWCSSATPRTEARQTSPKRAIRRVQGWTTSVAARGLPAGGLKQLDRAAGVPAVGLPGAAAYADERAHRDLLADVGKNPQAQKAYIFVRESGQGDKVIDDAQAPPAPATRASASACCSTATSPLTRFGIGVRCSNTNAQGNCPASSGTYAQIGQLNMYMEDVTAPAKPTISGPALSGWHAGTTAVRYDVSDQGAGVRWGSTLVNDTGFDLDSYCTPPENGNGHAKQMKPCPSSNVGGSSLTVDDPVFRQGENELTHCVSEYGTNPQTTCETDDVQGRHDRARCDQQSRHEGGPRLAPRQRLRPQLVEPARRAELVADRRRDAAGRRRGLREHLVAPGNRHRVDRERPGPVRRAGTRRRSTCVMRPATRRHSFRRSRTAFELKFDDTVPEPQAPNGANGWINAQDLAGGYVQGGLERRR